MCQTSPRFHFIVPCALLWDRHSLVHKCELSKSESHVGIPRGHGHGSLHVQNVHVPRLMHKLKRQEMAALC